MKKLSWLIVGVALGFVLAHKINDTPRGRAFFGEIDRKARDFSAALGEGYRERESELRAAAPSGRLD